MNMSVLELDTVAQSEMHQLLGDVSMRTAVNKPTTAEQLDERLKEISDHAASRDIELHEDDLMALFVRTLPASIFDTPIVPWDIVERLQSDGMEMQLDEIATHQLHQLLLDTVNHRTTPRKVSTAEQLEARIAAISESAASRGVVLLQAFVLRSFGTSMLTSLLYNSYIEDEILDYLAENGMVRDKLRATANK
jgi:hypothetical protein